MHTSYYQGDLLAEIQTSEEESHHAIKVLRKKVGDTLRVINGQGAEALGEIIEAHPKRMKLRLSDIQIFEKEQKKIILACAPVKSNDRMSFLLEKVTELGVSEIVPLICDNSERQKFNYDRWNKVILSATKQCRRKYLPLLKEAEKCESFLSSVNEANKLIAYCEDQPDLSIMNAEFSHPTTIICIGPEGDFSQKEIDIAVQNNWQMVHLGTNRLRTETAALKAVSLLV